MDLQSLRDDRLLTEFEPLLHKTLAKANISQGHSYYQDFLQELRLKLIDIAGKFDGNPLGADRYRFTAYAGRGLYWHLINLIKSHAQAGEILTETLELTQIPISQSHYALDLFMHEAKIRLAVEEYDLVQLLASGESLSECARLLDRPRSTLQDWLKRISFKLSEIKSLLSVN